MVQHNHFTRDIKPQGQCPGCDAYHASHAPEGELDFVCEAYGAEGVQFGAVCFFPQAGRSRTCGSLDECITRISAEQKQVYRHIQAAAAVGDEFAVDLAEACTHPGQLLNAQEDSPEGTP